MLNLLRLAVRQLFKEGIREPTDRQIISRVLIIISWIKKHGKHSRAIMAGAKIYQYGNTIKTYAGV
jgi:hypothetical protein